MLELCRAKAGMPGAVGLLAGMVCQIPFLHALGPGMKSTGP